MNNTLTHEEIWASIDRLAQSTGYSTSGLAKKAGLDPTSFNKSKRFSPDGKPRWPSTESISKILAATDTTFSDFLGLTENAGHATKEKTIKAAPETALTKVPLIHSTKPDKPPKQNFLFSALSDIHDPELCALMVDNDAFYPFYPKGSVLLLSPNSPIEKGHRVVVRPEGKGLFAGEIYRKAATRLDLITFHPDHEEYSFPAEKISWTARILWATQ